MVSNNALIETWALLQLCVYSKRCFSLNQLLIVFILCQQKLKNKEGSKIKKKI